MFSRERVWYNQSLLWSASESFYAAPRKRHSALLKAFTEHPAEIGETYFQHLRFTAGMSLRFLLLSLTIVIHGLFPFLFTTTAGRHVERIYAEMKSRIPDDRQSRTGRMHGRGE
jgi:Family of unknown function (DUF6356)